MLTYETASCGYFFYMWCFTIFVDGKMIGCGGGFRSKAAAVEQAEKWKESLSD